MLESIATDLAESLLIVCLVIGGLLYLMNKYLGLANNPEVKDFAKKAVAQKVISLLAKWLK